MVVAIIRYACEGLNGKPNCDYTWKLNSCWLVREVSDVKRVRGICSKRKAC